MTTQTRIDATDLTQRLALIADLPTKDATRARYDYDAETVTIHYGSQRRQRRVSPRTVQIFDSAILATIEATP